MQHHVFGINFLITSLQQCHPDQFTFTLFSKCHFIILISTIDMLVLAELSSRTLESFPDFFCYF